MKIAIIGSGISGLVAAMLLDKKYSVTVFEANDWIGGHVHTIPVLEQQRQLYIDTGFIVCNSVNYPNFLKLMQQLNISLQKTSMSFSVSAELDNLEYNGTSLNGLFAQRKNIVNPKFWRMLHGILKFNRAAKIFAIDGDPSISLQQFIQPLGLSIECVNYYLLPMVGAIWSNDMQTAMCTSAKFLCQFFNNHGMLNVNDRPQWYSIPGGSHVYVSALVKLLSQAPIINSPVIRVQRKNDKVLIKLANEQLEFDKVIIATHSDQALKILSDPSFAELDILSKIRYQENSVILHTDSAILPKNKRAWASWNYRVIPNDFNQCIVTYNMNMLQNLEAKQTYCVSLNQEMYINPDKIIQKFTYQHPVFDVAAINARAEFSQISGVNNTYYCGAYWGYGFHEDGMNSGLKVVKQIDKELFCTTPYILA